MNSAEWKGAFAPLILCEWMQRNKTRPNPRAKTFYPVWPVMRLTNSEVEHIATLSRLELNDAERERAANELSQIIGYFEALSELDTENVEPTMHALPIENVLRADEVRPGLSREAALQNAPESADGMFQVPRVVEAE